MMRFACLAALLTLFCCDIMRAEEIKTGVRERIEQSLQAGIVVRFYFVGRTGTYDYSPAEFAANSTIRVERDCGSNCHNLMASVLDHLDAAFPTPCLNGQQTELIEFGQDDRLYYHQRGQLIEYAGQCFFSAEPVGTLLRREAFFFN
jgi:hypothetical protein